MQFLSNGVGNNDELIKQIEGVWALAWVLSIVSVLDFMRHCDDTFYKLMPNLTILESSKGFRGKTRLREFHEVIQCCDFAYRLHWAARDAHLRHTPLASRLNYDLVYERRRALEWVIDPDTPWKDISLDT
jgi:hypothetical protein